MDLGVLDLEHSGAHRRVVPVELLELGDGNDVLGGSGVCLVEIGVGDEQLGVHVAPEHGVGGGVRALEQLAQHIGSLPADAFARIELPDPHGMDSLDVVRDEVPAVGVVDGPVDQLFVVG